MSQLEYFQKNLQNRVGGKNPGKSKKKNKTLASSLAKSKTKNKRKGIGKKKREKLRPGSLHWDYLRPVGKKTDLGRWGKKMLSGEDKALDRKA